MPEECVCGHSLAALNGRGINNHLMTCNTNAGAVTFAHNIVLRSVSQMCTDAGAQTNVEEAEHFDRSRTAAESASTRVSLAVEAGFAAQKALIRKETNAFYQLAASRLGDGAIIMPFAFERQGRLGKKALGLIKFCVGKGVYASLDITDSIQSAELGGTNSLGNDVPLLENEELLDEQRTFTV
eukprot:g76222.t1